jgi:hypothetical protein
MPIVLDGTAGITTPDLTDTSLTSGRVVYAGASGNLTGASALTFDGAQLYVNGGASGIPLQLNNNTGSNTNVLFSENNTAKWYVRNLTSDGGFSFVNVTTANQVMLLTGTGVKTFSTVSVGNATPAASGAGITFPASVDASSDANTLDDYEEGTWTPTLIDNGFNNGATLSSATGTYTKIGRCVTIQCILVMSTPCRPTTYLRTGGNPFSSSGDFAGTYTAGSVSTGRQGGFVFTVTSSLYWSQENGTTNSSAWFCTITYFV